MLPKTVRLVSIPGELLWSEAGPQKVDEAFYDTPGGKVDCHSLPVQFRSNLTPVLGHHLN
jgi:hypothetical protein